MRSLWELLIVRIISYIIFMAILFGAWRIVNAQERIVCQGQGGQTVCRVVPDVQVPSGPAFDSSVIGRIPDGVGLSPEAIRYLMIRKCIKQSQEWGLNDNEIRARCFR
jgi:hypothetical protein